MNRFIKATVAAMAAAIIVAAPIFFSSGNVSANPEGIEINEDNFPDKRFRMLLSETTDYGADYILTQEEIDSITSLDVSGNDIFNLKGIEYFTELKYLNCSRNNLSTLNVTSNKNLEYLDCSSNSLQYILTNTNHDLISLNCSNNQLESLSLHNNIALKSLYCDNNKLTKLNIKYNTELVDLGCFNNRLTSLDVSNQPNLVNLNCSYNQIELLNVTNNTKLVNLWCGNNMLGSIDLSSNTKLEELSVYGNQLNELNVSANTKLKLLDIDNNPITSISIEKNKDLESFYCSDCKLESLDLSANTNLLTLHCSNNDLTSLDVSHNTELQILYIYDNKISQIDISKNTKLWEFGCYRTDISKLEIYNSPNLVTAYVDGNMIRPDNTYMVYYTGKYPSEIKYYLGIDNDMTVVVKKPTATPKPATATPTPKPATATPTPKPSNSGSSGGSSSSSSEGGVEAFVERLYTVALGRASDPAGKADWINRVRVGGNTGADLARGFLFSDEFLGKNMSNSDFVDVLYATFFNRAADEHKADWLGLMDSGWSKTQVIDGFINSTEWANLCLTYGIASGTTFKPNITVTPSQDVIDFATRLYTTCLGREADEGGLNDWANQLANMQISGSEAAHGFFFSEEFLDGDYSATEYVTRLYRTFMGREPDQEGFNNWMNALASGQTREYVFQGFAGSQEWAGICADYGILK